MKNIYFFIILLLTIGNGQDFESDRLPIGHKNKKYDFCTVKIDKIFNTNINSELSFDEMIDDLRQKRIVLIGESHNNQLHHDVQLEIIEGLVNTGKPVVLALEMFNPEQNEKLAAWTSGTTDQNTFLEQTEFLTTWGHNYRYYKDIFDYAREAHIPIYGVNVDRKYATKISKNGLDSLSAEDLEAIPEIDTSNVEHKFLIKVMMEGLDATMPDQFENLYCAQSLWDAAMGEGAITTAQKHPESTVIVLAGSGHVIYNLGIGRIIKDRSVFSFSSVVTVDIPAETEESGMMKVKKDIEKEESTTKNPHMIGLMEEKSPYRIVVRSYADFLWGKEEMENEKYPSLGISIKELEGNGFPVKLVLPETIAYENGIRTGDVILTVDGQNFDNLFEIKKYLQYKNWDDEISFEIQRDNEKQQFSFIIEPIEEDD